MCVCALYCRLEIELHRPNEWNVSQQNVFSFIAFSFFLSETKLNFNYLTTIKRLTIRIDNEQRTRRFSRGDPCVERATNEKSESFWCLFRIFVQLKNIYSTQKKKTPYYFLCGDLELCKSSTFYFHFISIVVSELAWFLTKCQTVNEWRERKNRRLSTISFAQQSNYSHKRSANSNV